MFIMMVGLPYSGKDYYIEHNKHPDDIVVSSDEIREELYGDASVQTAPQKVFLKMRKRTLEGLATGKTVWYNATNLSMKHRVALLRDIRAKYGNSIETQCIIMATSLETIDRRRALRERKVDARVIKRMLMQFETPMFYEGWDYIEIEQEDNLEIGLEDIQIQFMGMEHDNIHHSQSIYDHMHKAFELASADNCGILINRTLYFHDIGKYFTKTFTNCRGEETKDAHYYGHANYGAYLVLAYDNDVYFRRQHGQKLLLEAWLINFHMRHYEVGFENWVKKYNIPKDLIDLLSLVNHYDKEAK